MARLSFKDAAMEGDRIEDRGGAVTGPSDMTEMAPRDAECRDLCEPGAVDGKTGSHKRRRGSSVTLVCKKRSFPREIEKRFPDSRQAASSDLPMVTNVDLLPCRIDYTGKAKTTFFFRRRRIPGKELEEYKPPTEHSMAASNQEVVSAVRSREKETCIVADKTPASYWKAMFRGRDLLGQKISFTGSLADFCGEICSVVSLDTVGLGASLGPGSEQRRGHGAPWWKPFFTDCRETKKDEKSATTRSEDALTSGNRVVSKVGHQAREDSELEDSPPSVTRPCPGFTKVMQSYGNFDSLTLWNHDAAPDLDDELMQWILYLQLNCALHACPDT